MKSNPIRMLLAVIACLVPQTITTRAAEEEAAKPEQATYLVTLKRTLLSGEAISETSCYVSSSAGEFGCTIPADMKAQSKQPLIVGIDAYEKSVSFTVSDLSMLQQGVREGSSYSYPTTILQTEVKRRKSDTYTLLATNTEKLTISFKKIDPKDYEDDPASDSKSEKH